MTEKENVVRRKGRRAGPAYGTRAGGRPAKRKTLLIDGIIQDGHYQLVTVTSETIVLQTINAGHAPGKE